MVDCAFELMMLIIHCVLFDYDIVMTTQIADYVVKHDMTII